MGIERVTGLGDEQLKVSGGVVDPVVELLVVGEDLDPGGTVECGLVFHRGQGPAVIGHTETGASAGTGDGNFKRTAGGRRRRHPTSGQKLSGWWCFLGLPGAYCLAAARAEPFMSERLREAAV
jgi:hypothetical protein